MKIEVNIGKKNLFVVLGTILLLSGLIFVYAFNPSGTGGNPPVFGHDASELGPGRFSNLSSADMWVFPGLVQIEGLGFNDDGARGVFVDSTGKLFSESVSGPESDVSLLDEFVGGTSLPWTERDTAPNHIPSEIGRPGILSYGDGMYLKEALNTRDSFEVTFVIAPPSTISNGFKNAAYKNMEIGLFNAPNNNVASTSAIIFKTYHASSGGVNWLTLTTSGGTPATTTLRDTGVELPDQEGEWVKLKISRTKEGVVNFYINDELVETHTTFIPEMSLYIGTRVHDSNVRIDSFKLDLRDLEKKALLCVAPPIYTSGASLTIPGGFTTINVPSNCTGSITGCIIRQEIVDRNNKVVFSKAYSYKQEGTNGMWTGSYSPGVSAKNGDTAASYITLPYHDRRISLTDDYSVTGGEISSSQWTVRDSSTSYGIRLYRCAYASAS